MTDASTARVSSYELILPPGWAQHPVKTGTADKLLEHIRGVFEQAPQAAPLYTQLRASVFAAMRDLKANGGIDIFLPVRSRSGQAIPASLISSRVTLGDRGIDAALTKLARGAEVEEVDTGIGTAYVWNTTTKGRDDFAGVDSANRLTLFPLPGEQSQLGVLFTFGVVQTPEMEDEYRELLFLFFDALMQSVVWVFDEAS